VLITRPQLFTKTSEVRATTLRSCRGTPARLLLVWWREGLCLAPSIKSLRAWWLAGCCMAARMRGDTSDRCTRSGPCPCARMCIEYVWVSCVRVCVCDIEHGSLHEGGHVRQVHTLRTCPCARICIVYVCVHVCPSARVCMYRVCCVFVYLCVCVHVCLCARVCIYCVLCVCIFVCMCACVCAIKCVCVRNCNMCMLS